MMIKGAINLGAKFRIFKSEEMDLYLNLDLKERANLSKAVSYKLTALWTYGMVNRINYQKQRETNLIQALRQGERK